MRTAPLVLFMTLSGQVANFLVHHQAHQRQPRFPQQMPHSLLQQADHIGHRKDHLNVGVFFVG
jgi:hypothetical protein